MRAWVHRSTDGPGSFHLEEAPTPEPGPGEVRVRLRASALNHLDLWVARGMPSPPSLPHVSGADGAGVVDALGHGVTTPAVGEPIVIDPSTSCGRCPACRRGDVPLCPQFRIVGEHRWGTNAEHVVLPAENAVPKPNTIDWPEAASFGLALSSAVRMARRGRLAAGETALITGIGGGVSLMALLLCRAMDVRTLVTSRDADKLARAIEMGAEAGFDSTIAFSEDVLRATEGRGVDVIFENVGPAVWDEAMRSLARGGRLVTNGGTTGRSVQLHLPSFFWRQQEVIGATMNDHREFARAVELIASGDVVAPVDSTFAFEEFPEALARLEAGEQFGKIVLEHR